MRSYFVDAVAATGLTLVYVGVSDLHSFGLANLVVGAVVFTLAVLVAVGER